MKRLFFSILPLFIIVSLALVACDSNGAMDGDATVALNAVAVDPPAPKAQKTASSHLEITEVKILLKSIAFHTADEEVEGEGEEPPAEEEDDHDTFRLDPVVISLVPGEDPLPVDVGVLPIDTYDKVSFHIHKPRGNETPLDPDFAGDTPSERFSIVVYGIAEPGGDVGILYRSTQNVVHVVDFETAFVPGEDDASAVTLETDLSGWFVHTDGTDLDPSDTSGQNRSRIDRSIRDSFRVFVDDDADGVEDGEEG